MFSVVFLSVDGKISRPGRFFVVKMERQTFGLSKTGKGEGDLYFQKPPSTGTKSIRFCGEHSK